MTIDDLHKAFWTGYAAAQAIYGIFNKGGFIVTDAEIKQIAEKVLDELTGGGDTIDPKYLPKEWQQIVTDVADLKGEMTALQERVTALENGNTGGGGSGGGGTAEQIIVEFSRYGEYSTEYFGELPYYQVSSEVPTRNQFDQQELEINFDSGEGSYTQKFILTETYYDDYYGAWFGKYLGEYDEVGYNSYWVAVVYDETKEHPNGVYVSFDNIESDMINCIIEGHIIFPEVTA